MIVLGVMTFGINPSACLIVDGEVIALAEEERFVRQKGANNLFPSRAVQYCLSRRNLTLADVDLVAIGRDPSRYLQAVPEQYARGQVRYRKNVGTLRWESAQLAQLNPDAANRFVRDHLVALGGMAQHPPVEWVGHHRAHAASAAFMSGFADAALLTMDGHGDEDCTVLWSYRDGAITEVERYTIPDSIGWFYSAFTGLFGFQKNYDEGKLMGLAAYGKPTDHWREQVAKVLSWSNDRYHLDMNYIWYGDVDERTGIARPMTASFGPPRAGRHAVFSQDDCDLAFAVQEAFENVILNLARRALALTGSRNVALAGGCALNCKANGVVARALGGQHVWVQPISSDAGCSLGAALVAAQAGGDTVARATALDTIYWGPRYDNAAIEEALGTSGLRYAAHDDIARFTARALADGKVIGWFQEAMEVGPRALGARSIIADPTRLDANERVNNVKQRELWRPFCPSLIADAASDYFDEDFDAPFMVIAQQAKPGIQELIPGVIHADGSARPQYVTAQRHERFHRLIGNLAEHTGHPVVLNTSFNVQGEPIVCSPADAIRTFLNSNLDAIALGDYWVEKAK